MNNRKKTTVFVLTGIMVICIISEVTAQDWPWFRGTNRNGISETPFEWPVDGPKQVWKTNVGVGHSAISVVDGRAYTMGNRNDTDMVVCLDIKTGTEIWRHSYACEATYFQDKPFDGPGATPTVDRGVVYTLSRSGHVFALNAMNGNVIWKRDVSIEEGAKRPQWGFAGSVLIEEENVILNAMTGGICLDRKTGKTLWKTGGIEGGYATPVPIVVNGKTQIVIFGTQTITVVDPGNGSVLWETSRPQPIGLNAADPVVDGTKFFVSAGRRMGGALYDVAGNTTPLWDNKNMNSHWQTCVLWNGYLYGCEGNNAAGAGRSPIALRCIDWKTGEIVWEETSLDFFGLIVADGKLLMLTDGGELIVAEASVTGYKELGRAKVIEPHGFMAPVISDGFVYLRNTEGDVVCLNMQP